MKRSKHHRDSSEDTSDSESDTKVERKIKKKHKKHSKHEGHHKRKVKKEETESSSESEAESKPVVVKEKKSHKKKKKSKKESSSSSSSSDSEEEIVSKSHHSKKKKSKNGPTHIDNTAINVKSEPGLEEERHRHEERRHRHEDNSSRHKEERPRHHHHRHHHHPKEERSHTNDKPGHSSRPDHPDRESKWSRQSNERDSNDRSHASNSFGTKDSSNRSHPSGNAQRRDKGPKKQFCDDNEEYEWGKKDANNGDSNNTDQQQPKQKPNFGLSGKLTEDTNTFNGVVIKYSEPPDARKPKRRWRLYPFKEDSQLPVLHIHRQSAFLMGRDRKVADIPVDHPSCSKQHAALQYRLTDYTREDGSKGKRIRLYIIDLESANGTFVNNKKIDPKRYVELLEKDVIKFGFSSREYVLLHEHSKDSDADDDVVDDE